MTVQSVMCVGNSEIVDIAVINRAPKLHTDRYLPTGLTDMQRAVSDGGTRYIQEKSSSRREMASVDVLLVEK
jgi:hypothetical protein